MFGRYLCLAATSFVLTIFPQGSDCYEWEICFTGVDLCTGSGDGDGYIIEMLFDGSTVETWTYGDQTPLPSSIRCSDCCDTYGPSTSNVILTFNILDDEWYPFSDELLWTTLSSTWTVAAGSSWSVANGVADAYGCQEKVFFDVTDLSPTPRPTPRPTPSTTPSTEWNEVQLIAYSVLDLTISGTMTLTGCKSLCEERSGCNYLTFEDLVYSGGANFQCTTFNSYDSIVSNPNAISVSYTGASLVASTSTSQAPTPSPTPAPTPSPIADIASGCVVDYEYWIGDGVCDEWGGYNTAECDWDGGDCATTLTPTPISTDDSTVDDSDFVSSDACSIVVQHVLFCASCLIFWVV